MRRKLLIILAAIVAFGPAVSILYVAYVRWGRLAAEYLSTTWAIISLISAYVAFVLIFNRVLQMLRPGHPWWHSAGLCVGTPGEFYTASLILSAHLSDEDFLRMANDQNPVVCAMALIVLAARDIARYQTTIRSFYDEAIEVMYMPMGCGVDTISLGELARNILEAPNTLQHWDPKKTEWLWSRGSK